MAAEDIASLCNNGLDWRPGFVLRNCLSLLNRETKQNCVFKQCHCFAFTEKNISLTDKDFSFKSSDS